MKRVQLRVEGLGVSPPSSAVTETRLFNGLVSVTAEEVGGLARKRLPLKDNKSRTTGPDVVMPDTETLGVVLYCLLMHSTECVVLVRCDKGAKDALHADTSTPTHSGHGNTTPILGVWVGSTRRKQRDPQLCSVGRIWFMFSRRTCRENRMVEAVL